MKSKSTQTLLALLLIVGLLLAIPAGAAHAADLARRGAPSRGAAAGASLVPLNAAEADALERAVLEEYGALNTYRAVIAQFGAVQPFTAIARSEQQHVNALLRQATKYGIDAPANPGLAAVFEWQSIADACQTGVEAEIADAALYDELVMVTEHADLVRVYQNLQAASLNNHLPAFDACN